MTTPSRITHLIAGTRWTGESERTGEVFNPATGEVTGILDLASSALVGEVVSGAKNAWLGGWRDASLTKRTQVLFAFREKLNANKHRIAAMITSAAQGRLHRERVLEGRRLLDPAEPRRGRGDLAVQLPRHGAALVRPDSGGVRKCRRDQA